jgi:hypothetical protein
MRNVIYILWKNIRYNSLKKAWKKIHDLKSDEASRKFRILCNEKSRALYNLNYVSTVKYKKLQQEKYVNLLNADNIFRKRLQGQEMDGTV